MRYFIKGLIKIPLFVIMIAVFFILLPISILQLIGGAEIEQTLTIIILKKLNSILDERQSKDNDICPILQGISYKTIYGYNIIKRVYELTESYDMTVYYCGKAAEMGKNVIDLTIKRQKKNKQMV